MGKIKKKGIERYILSILQLESGSRIITCDKTMNRIFDRAGII